MKIYRVRKGNLYSKGGLEPRFTKKGKIWTGKNYLKNHFNMLKERFLYYKYRGGEHLIEEHFQKEIERIYGDSVIEEMNFETGETKETPIREFLGFKTNKENVDV
jgi:hypothetical protein